MEKAAKTVGHLVGSTKEKASVVTATKALDANNLIEVHNMNSNVKLAANQEDQYRVRDLEDAVTSIHGLAMEGLSQIEAVARVSLLAMQTPEAYRFPENIAMTLEVIWSIAQNIQGCVGSTAEDVGCAERDTAHDRRLAARATLKGLAV